MASVEKSIEVSIPLQTVYNQWTQFEEFPRFMEGVEEVRQLEESRLFWAADLGSGRKEWYARITRQIPDELVAWESEGGTVNAGSVRFKPGATDQTTEVQLHIEYEPEGMKEQIGDALGFVSRRVEGDLKRFKEFIESRGMETGAWRGEISDAADTASGRYGAQSPDRPGSSGQAPMPNEGDADRMRYGATGQGGAGYGGTAQGGTHPGTPGSPPGGTL